MVVDFHLVDFVAFRAGVVGLDHPIVEEFALLKEGVLVVAVSSEFPGLPGVFAVEVEFLRGTLGGEKEFLGKFRELPLAVEFAEALEDDFAVLVIPELKMIAQRSRFCILYGWLGRDTWGIPKTANMYASS